MIPVDVVMFHSIIDGVLTSYSKGEKVTAKAHGGLIDIQGVTVAEVDEKIRMKAIQTWMDPLEMFRQIAPYGVVRKETMNRKIDLEAALDTSSDDGNKVAPEYNNEAGSRQDSQRRASDTAEAHSRSSPALTLDQVTAESITNSNPHQAAETGMLTATPGRSAAPDLLANTQNPDEMSLPKCCAMVDVASADAAELEVQVPDSNAPDVTPADHLKPVSDRTIDQSIVEDKGESIADAPRSTYSSAVTGNVEDVLLSARRGEFQDESKAAGVYDAIDEHLSKPAEVVHPAGHEVLSVGHALAAAPDSEETRIAHEEMSSMMPSECPFLQNRE